MANLTKSQKSSYVLILSLCAMHALTMFAKTNYSASVAYIVSRGIFSKANAGTIASVFYILYAIGQVLGGFLVDKFSPYKMALIGILGAIVGNLVLCFTTNYLIILVTWSLCGIVQFGIWPSVCKLIATDVLPEQRSKASVYIQYADQAGGLLSYIFVATVLEYFGWTAMFLCSVISLVLLLVLWFYIIISRSKSEEGKPSYAVKGLTVNKNHNHTFWGLCLSFGVVIILLLNLSDAMLLNGAQIWVPTMIMESYEGMLSGFSSTIVIIMFGAKISALAIFRPLLIRVKKPAHWALVVYLISLIPMIFMQFIGDLPLVLIVAMLSIHAALVKMKAVFMMQYTYTFAKFGLSGTYGGVLNAFASLGIVLASYSYGVISESFGWVAVTLTWLGLTIFSILSIIFPLIRWKKFKNLANTI